MSAERQTPQSPTSSDAWWARLLAFSAGLGFIITLLFVNARDVYLEGTDVRDRQALAESRHRKVLLLGTSHGYDLNLKEAGLSGVDMTHGGQDLFEMAFMARTVKERSRRLDTVIISLSYFSFSFDNSAYTLDGVKTRIGRRITLYTDFRRMAFIPGDGAEFLKGMLYPVVTLDHYQLGFQTLLARLTPGASVPGAPSASQPPPSPVKRKPRDWYVRHAQRRCKSFGEFASNMAEHHPGLAEDSFNSTLELVRELQAASVRVIFFTPPYTTGYNECFEQTYVKQAIEGGHRLQSLTGAPYFDFSHDPDFVENIRLFEDSDHLNDEGRKRFSRRFKEALDAQRR